MKRFSVTIDEELFNKHNEPDKASIVYVLEIKQKYDAYRDMQMYGQEMEDSTCSTRGKRARRLIGKERDKQGNTAFNELE
ncbi:Uncharacterized protein TCM_022375 [Theobroma cacao]|uniref:Uncharacterized protein n=1 Tax=Theobroma cacao TaxID=3641 RepID=A0A061EUI1_THECC|nr:Uncharacterized protein TCM_022375 [Theobroma cacao]